jgi:DMSO/TMAO reductase YedYZ heme-binding membrane subunit
MSVVSYLARMSAVDFSGTVALGAIGLLTANLLLGLLLAVGYNPVRQWPKRRIKLFTFHNWTGYVALAAVVLHASALLLSSDPRFAFADVLWPTKSPVQPRTTTLGAVGFYLLAFAVFTSLKRVRATIGRHWWKLFHWTTYGAAGFFFAHGIIADPLLKGRPPDLVDAEKVYIEICALLVIVATGLRIRHRRSVTRAGGPK